MRTEADYDPRIVDLYDGDNPDGPDHDFYRGLADASNAASVLDIGCGTGMLTVSLASDHRRVVGVDPSPTMLAYARQRDGADRVTWVDGDSRAIPAGHYDLVVMTGNVAQHIPDPQWEQTLRHIRAVASPNAVLSFESRNPARRAWEDWASEAPATRETMHGSLREWYEVEDQGSGRVLLRSVNEFEGSETHLVHEAVLTFRSQERITAQLEAAGFETTSIWGDWHHTPCDGSQPLMVFEARPV